jgi:hypothetical protein
MNDAPPTARPAANAPPRRGRILSLLAIIGSGVMIPLGIGIFGLGLLPSDMPQFFLLLGLHVIASGGLGLLHPLTKGRGVLRRSLQFASVVVNGALVVRLVVFAFTGMVRGPMVLAVPLLLGVPAVLNVVAAVLGSGRPNPPGTCRQCGYDLRGLKGSRCPECGLDFSASPHPEPREQA